MGGIITLASGNWYTITDNNGSFSNSDGGQRADLVPGQDPKKLLKGIERFVKERLPKDCRADFPYARGTQAISGARTCSE